MFNASERTAELLLGERKISAAAPEINDLRMRSGQEDDLTVEPQYFMASIALRSRRPAAVLIRRNKALEACVFFYEHCAFRMGLGMHRGGDYMGEALVTGSEPLRTHYVHFAVQFLLGHWHIHGVSISIKAPVEECIEIMGPENQFRRFRGKTVQHKFRLGTTYEATLATLGHRTRRSLAKKREQLEKRTNVQFLPNLDLDQTMEAMLALQPVSFPKREEAFFRARGRLIQKDPGFFFNMGLRLPNGTWLSVLSGWRIRQVTYIDTQMNHAEFKKESISAVMRAFMLEHETGLQQEFLNFVAGSSLLFRRYCEPIEPCTDIFIGRPGLLAKVSEAVATRLRPGTVYERLGVQPEGEEREEVFE